MPTPSRSVRSPALPRAPARVATWRFDDTEWGKLGGTAAIEDLLAHRPAAWLRRVDGRETFVWPGRDGACVVKRVRGVERRDWWYEVLRSGRARPAGRVEAENLRELALAGFPVPRPIAAAAAGGTSLVVMERIGHDADLASRLADAPRAARDARLAEVAELVARLHAAGFYHRDLYLQHLVLPREPRAGAPLVLLDCGRVRREARPRERWFVKDLAALAHSLPPSVGADEWRAFVARYRERRGAGPELDALLAAVESKRARLAAHAPRRVDPAGGGRSSA